MFRYMTRNEWLCGFHGSKECCCEDLIFILSYDKEIKMKGLELGLGSNLPLARIGCRHIEELSSRIRDPHLNSLLSDPHFNSFLSDLHFMY